MLHSTGYQSTTEESFVRLSGRMNEIGLNARTVKADVEALRVDSTLTKEELKKAVEVTHRELSIKIKQQETELDNTRHEFAARSQRHAEEISRYHGLKGHWDAVIVRHDALAQAVASNHVETRRRADQLVEQLDQSRQEHAALQKGFAGYSQMASRRVDQLSATLEEMKKQTTGDVAELSDLTQRRLQTFDGQLKACVQKLDEAVVRIGNLERASDGTAQQMIKLQSEETSAANSISKILENHRKLTLQLKEHEGRHNVALEEANASCRDFFSKHQAFVRESAKEATLRADQLAVSIDKVQQSLQQAISRTVGETNCQLTALDGKLDVQGKLVDKLHANWRKLPEVEAHHADLRSRLNDIASAAKVQLEEFLVHSETSLEERLFEQAQGAGEQVARALDALNRRADVIETTFASQLADATRRLERSVEEELACAREMLSHALVDAQEDLSNLREVWLPSANGMAAAELQKAAWKRVADLQADCKPVRKQTPCKQDDVARRQGQSAINRKSRR